MYIRVSNPGIPGSRNPGQFIKFSIPGLKDMNGLTISSNKNTCELKSGNDIVAVGVRNGNLFKINFKVVSAEHNVNVGSKRETFNTWQERFSYLNVRDVRNFLKDHNISYNDADFTCEACIM
jgi:hypothetical protein